MALPDAVRNCLSIMNCCGVNDYSGEFMFEVGSYVCVEFSVWHGMWNFLFRGAATQKTEDYCKFGTGFYFFWVATPY